MPSSHIGHRLCRHRDQDGLLVLGGALQGLKGPEFRVESVGFRGCEISEILPEGLPEFSDGLQRLCTPCLIISAQYRYAHVSRP